MILVIFFIFYKKKVYFYIKKKLRVVYEIDFFKKTQEKVFTFSRVFYKKYQKIQK